MVLCSLVGVWSVFGGRGVLLVLFGFHTNVRKPTCPVQEVEIGVMVHVTHDWEWGKS